MIETADQRSARIKAESAARAANAKRYQERAGSPSWKPALGSNDDKADALSGAVVAVTGLKKLRNKKRAPVTQQKRVAQLSTSVSGDKGLQPTSRAAYFAAYRARPKPCPHCGKDTRQKPTAARSPRTPAAP